MRGSQRLPSIPRRLAEGEGYDPGMREMEIEVWSDVVCSWCYIGKRRMEEASANCPLARKSRARGILSNSIPKCRARV